MTARSSSSWPLRVAAGVAVVFGLLTIVSGGRTLFGGPAAIAAAGDAVPFVLWFNFLSGFIYVLAGIGIAMDRRWAAMLSMGLAATIAAVFALFGLYALQGAAFEMRTVGAMSLRLIVWVAIAAVAARHIDGRKAGHRVDSALCAVPRLWIGLVFLRRTARGPGACSMQARIRCA
ncbi:hypothetical protein [Salinarimonas ramus]|uniref:Uncharacterized protein n=1 Tax=Salinarimonas ramus TaxID=690164 RepID=A0A917QHY9_9HYPH|nr:hypothetical protein [Salinarimonas ramus]GGK51639.1 hypothetical protein GCM10011322_43320 [Salinarimonas ramus]